MINHNNAGANQRRTGVPHKVTDEYLVVNTFLFNFSFYENV